MKNQFYNDQRSIAEQLIFLDTHICQMASLAYQKVHTLKLSYIHSAYCNSRKELYELVKSSLLNYVSPDFVLHEEKYFDNVLEN